eukprot:COSAG01_NODE_59249_length_301_cov_0.935644_1_plen_65_part_01
MMTTPVDQKVSEKCEACFQITEAVTWVVSSQSLSNTRNNTTRCHKSNSKHNNDDMRISGELEPKT